MDFVFDWKENIRKRDVERGGTRRSFPSAFRFVLSRPIPLPPSPSPSLAAHISPRRQVLIEGALVIIGSNC